MDIRHLRGICVALYGCYDSKDHVDGDKAARLACYYADKGVTALYLTGSSGEGMLQSEDERALIYEAVASAVRERVTLIAHVGAASTQEAARLARSAAKAGVHAISSVPNIYYHVNETMIQRHWNTIIEAGGLPFIMYNTPSTTGTDISLALFETMLKNPLVAGIKHTGTSCGQIAAFRRRAGEDFAIFNGMDNQLLAGLVMGASSGIGGTYGAMPEIYMNLYDSFSRGDMDGAMLWQNRACEILEIMQRCLNGNIGCAFSKALLSRRGFNISPARRPAGYISPDQPEVVACAEMIDGWINPKRFQTAGNAVK